ncbi:MAG: hypothetical protein LUI06_06265 [Ruminococcus sp.]|nr:hypothetical protein [Ruminococcus sp.]
MRYLKLMLSEFFTENKSNLLLSLTIYFTVSVCFFSIFTSMRVVQKNAVAYSDTQIARATYNDLQIDTSSYSSCEEVVNAINTLEDTYSASISGVYFNFTNNELSHIIEGVGEVSDTIEIVNNAKLEDNEIVCSENLFFDGKIVKAGDRITLYGKELEVSKIASESYINRDTFLSFDDTALNSISFNIDSLIFPLPLSDDEYGEVSKILVCDDVLTSCWDIQEEENAQVLSDQILICILISSLAALIIITLFKQVMRNLISKIAGFKLYGCRSGFVIGFFVFSLCIYIIISFAIALVAFSLCDNLFVYFNLIEKISFSLEMLSFAIVCILAMLFTFPNAYKLARLMPVQLEIRR